MTEQYENESWRQITQEEMRELYNRILHRMKEEEMRGYYDPRNITIVPLIEVEHD